MWLEILKFSVFQTKSNTMPLQPKSQNKESGTNRSVSESKKQGNATGLKDSAVKKVLGKESSFRQFFLIYYSRRFQCQNENQMEHFRFFFRYWASKKSIFRLYYLYLSFFFIWSKIKDKSIDYSLLMQSLIIIVNKFVMSMIWWVDTLHRYLLHWLFVFCLPNAILTPLPSPNSVMFYLRHDFIGTCQHDSAIKHNIELSFIENLGYHSLHIYYTF